MKHPESTRHTPPQADAGFPPTRSAALARIAAVQPEAYARTRNAIDGAVTRLSPYITHGLVTLPEVLAGVATTFALPVQHKFVYELGWREYFRHVWAHRGDGILQSLHPGPLPDEAYAREMPADVAAAATGIPAIDEAVRELAATGWLHNHARMWLASYLVHGRKVHWRTGADWMLGQLLDGDLASNHLSWQWVAGTGSHKPYLFNADNVARHAPPSWHSRGSAIDRGYDALEDLARSHRSLPAGRGAATLSPPPLLHAPPPEAGFSAPLAEAVVGRDVWLVHPWSLRPPPPGLPAGTVIIGVAWSDWHQAWPWTAARWLFVAGAMATLTRERWYAPRAAVAAVLGQARSVQAEADPHAEPALQALAPAIRLWPAPQLFRTVERACASFSQWWTQVTRGVHSVHELPGLQTQLR
jgi:deoxyribodipyrimidine photo-lyase